MKILNKKIDKYSPLTDRYIGRPTIFGNPFTIGIDGSREEVIEKYRLWLTTETNYNTVATKERKQQLLKELPKLKNCNLICHCKPLPCHGDVLLELIQNLEK